MSVRKYNLEADFLIHNQFARKLEKDFSEARSVFEESVADSENPKKLFEYIRSSLSSKVTLTLPQKEDGTFYGSQSESAEVLADSFPKDYSIEPKSDHIPEILIPRVKTDVKDVQFTPEVVTFKYSMR
ncbi:hypothetical protein HHI36_007054 [Cryptolaemus montrouzieri]|uniref:Uncharacterized protein n=1 Tax=Cryptolaemus montrouzieri TaxID=559131 RepID=A0ABD2MND6_9CUCU